MSPSPHLSTSCNVAHKASTQLRQSALSAAAICTSLQFFHPAFSVSLSAVLRHVVLGLPQFRRHSGVQVNAVLQSLFGSFLMMWPMNFHLRLRTFSLRFSISAIIRTSLFVILSCQRILNIGLRHLLWKTSILFSSLLFIFHVSQPDIKTGFTSVLYSLIRVFKVSVICFVLRGWVIGPPPNPQPGGPGAILCLASTPRPIRHGSTCQGLEFQPAQLLGSLRHPSLTTTTR